MTEQCEIKRVPAVRQGFRGVQGIKSPPAGSGFARARSKNDYDTRIFGR
nr:MAG TPA: hypothetical protein [Caudoviricetes sp.]